MLKIMIWIYIKLQRKINNQYFQRGYSIPLNFNHKRLQHFGLKIARHHILQKVIFALFNCKISANK